MINFGKGSERITFSIVRAVSCARSFKKKRTGENGKNDNCNSASK